MAGKFKYITDNPLFDVHTYDVDVGANHIYLMGSEEYGPSYEGDEPGVEFSMANRLIRNLNILMRKGTGPILIHMKTCLSRKTPILTKDGYKKIKDIEPGDLVLTHTGAYKPVIERMSHMYGGEMTRLFYGRKNNHETSLVSTSDHPIWIERNGVRSWMPASQIITGDIIFVESSECKRTGEKVPYWKNVKNYNAKRLRRKGKNPQYKKVEEKILYTCEQLKEQGWTVVPVDMMVRPDIVGFKDGKVTVFEVENMKGKSLEVKKEKYENAPINNFIDDIVWITPDTKSHYSWYEIDTESCFVKVKVTGIKRWYNKYSQRVYNLEVEEDNSFIANHVVVHNCGGDWTEGMAIYDAIKSCPNNVCILSYTHARSMSSLIFQAADKRVMMPNSTFMFHDGTMGYEGTCKQFLTEADELKKYNEIMLNIYIDSMKEGGKMAKLGRDKIKAWLRSQMNKKEDVYLSAQQAIDYGFADEIFDADWDSLLKFE